LGSSSAARTPVLKRFAKPLPVANLRERLQWGIVAGFEPFGKLIFFDNPDAVCQNFPALRPYRGWHAQRAFRWACSPPRRKRPQPALSREEMGNHYLIRKTWMMGLSPSAQGSIR